LGYTAKITFCLGDPGGIFHGVEERVSGYPPCYLFGDVTPPSHGTPRSQVTEASNAPKWDPHALAVQLPMFLVPAGASICPVNHGGGSTIAANPEAWDENTADG